VFEGQGYLLDTHTAVGFSGYERYLEATKDKTPALVVSTASPYKFAPSVLEALTGKAYEPTPETLVLLSDLTKTEIPAPLEGLSKKPERFRQSIDPAEMKDALKGLLNLQ
jgi:threonine synthase